MANIKTILYKQKVLKNQEHPVMLYVYEDKPYRISLGMSCTPKQWDEIHGRFRKNKDNFKSKNLILRQQELKANELIDDFVRHGERFNFDLFKQKFTGKEVKKKEKTFDKFFQEMIEEKKSLGKAGTSLGYRDGYNALKRYRNKSILFSDINYSFLKGLETFLFKTGCSEGGINAYMRTIRAVYYEAIRRNLCDKNLNPFSTVMNKDGYSISKLKSNLNPKALNLEDIEKFKAFDIEKYPVHADSWRYFMFSFWMFGINFIDIANLTKENIQNDRVVYVRQKTGKNFNIKMRKEAYEIFQHFNRNDGDYIFPIFNKDVHISPMQKKNRSKKVLRKINWDLKKIAEMLGIDENITFYTARHTSATTLKRKGISTDVISEALGHSDMQVTQHYLKKFDNDVLDDAVNML